MEAIQAFLENVKLGGKQSHQNMALFPRAGIGCRGTGLSDPGEALTQGLVEITEVNSAGSVPDLKLVNKSANNLLVVDGEELIGAKQNRIVNATFLIAGNTEIIIPRQLCGAGKVVVSVLQICLR